MVNPNITPLEFFGRYLRWKFIRLVNSDVQEFDDFKSLNRKRLLDILIGTFAMGIIIIVVSFILLIVKGKL